VGEGKKLIGASVEYRPRARDNTKKEAAANLELFGISRDVSPQSTAFYGLLSQVRRELSRRGKSKIKEPPGLKLMNRGLVSSIVNAGTGGRRLEQKDLRRFCAALVDSLNGLGSKPVEVSAYELLPRVIARNGKFIGSLVVARTAANYPTLAEANRKVRDKLAEMADSDSGRKALEPRIDIYKTTDERRGKEIIERLAEALREQDAPVLLEPAKSYKVPR